VIHKVKMTEENQKKLYDHFVENGDPRAEEILAVYPDFKTAKPKEEKKKK